MVARNGMTRLFVVCYGGGHMQQQVNTIEVAIDQPPCALGSAAILLNSSICFHETLTNQGETLGA